MSSFFEKRGMENGNWLSIVYYQTRLLNIVICEMFVQIDLIDLIFKQ